MARGYDQLKEFGGRKYMGMKVGRSHRWKYDAGDWKEKKVTPDKWEVEYAVKKHRAGRAPEGSGAPVGTSHHWYILAHQIVTKEDANTYTTELRGVKWMVAFKRADKGTWSASDAAQRRKVVKILKEAIAEIEKAEEVVAASEKAKPAPKPRRARKHAA